MNVGVSDYTAFFPLPLYPMCMSVSMVWGMQGPRDHLIILPWLWALGVCLKELGGKKHREDNWRVPCGRQEGSCWGESSGLPADKLLSPQSLTTPQRLSPGMICSL